ncbi:MAG TPA: ComEC/Rec2 family competence protein [Xanthobacteraceae bacterium]|nr:ComEC/Rec2 family competence protein [Xanthobacteraceae bacterium]
MSGQGERPRAKAQTWPLDATARLRGAVPSRFRFAESLRERLSGLASAEAGPGRLVPWVPVGFGIGIALYFSADHEPIAIATLLAAAVFCAGAFCLRRSRGFPVAVLLAAVAGGFSTATLKAAWMAHPILQRPVYAQSITGFVETREEREKSDRFVLRVAEIDVRNAPAASNARQLKRVRLAVKKGTAPEVGSFIAAKARLTPPLQPLLPGGYDFARDLYFQGIGASGFVLGAIEVRRPPQDGGWRLRYAAAMQGMRDAIDARIRTVIHGDNRAIATALLTGRRDAISTPVNDAMFISGLGHILSISGYHMAVVAGVVFFVLRALLALHPGWTVALPIKKIAAGAALIGATFYLLLSGAEVATQRSYFMTAVVLIAVMVDRRAITFRTLAVAAMLVLLIAPEALVHPSFQMSFAATLGLVALVQFGLPRILSAPDHGAVARAALWGGRELMMLTAASLIAGLATTPYAAFHFHRLAPYGVLANLAAMPVVSGLVMPAGMLGLAAMPFGLDGVFWHLMGLGIEWMVLISLWVAALPGAVGRVAAFGVGPLLAMTAGLLAMGMLRTQLRWLGLACIAVGIAWGAASAGSWPAMLGARPDVFVSADGKSVAVRGADGRLAMMRSGNDAFTTRAWLAADADERQPGDPSLRSGVSCDTAGCVAPIRGGGLAALALQPEAFADDCAQASVIVTLHQSPPSCAALVIGEAELLRQGAIALRRTPQGGFFVSAAHAPGQDRPWRPAPKPAELSVRSDVAAPADEQPKNRAGAPRLRPRAPIDATPPEDEAVD